MLSGKQIKIVKRAQRRDSHAIDSSEKATSEETKRDALTIVTEWVSELRRKKARETAHGFQSLFGKAG
ncbi:MAG TPA: hypothetical protein VNS63_22950 [Blastocatellia bacterium]|nr:hypothetical protein [Blastocatellia bacterium]